MKRNSQKKIELAKSKLEPSTGAESSQCDGLPPGLELFAQMKDMTHVQQIATCSPKFANAVETGNMEAIERMAGFLWGTGLDLGIQLPEWAKAASGKVWQTIGFSLLTRLESKPQTLAELQPDELGKFIGLLEQSENDSQSQVDQAALNLVELVKREAANLPPEDAKKFFNGRAAPSKTVEKLEHLPQRAKVFLIIACAWNLIAKMQSAGELHRWLLENKVIVSGTDAAETRAVCRIIKFNPLGKSGRPRKLK